MSDSNRMITSAIRSSVTFASLDYQQRDFWHGLIVMADDQGRLRGHAQWLKSNIWPYDDVPVNMIEEYLQKFSQGEDRFIHVYEVKGQRFIQILKWWKYQNKSAWAAPSAFPAPEGWVDRMRYHAKANALVVRNWDKAGGFPGDDGALDPIETTELPSALGSEQGSDEGRALPGNEVKDEVKDNDEEEVEGDFNSEAEGRPAPGLQKQAAVPGKKLSQDTQRKLWYEAIGQLQREMPKVDFDTWVRPLRLGGMTGNVLHVIAMNSYGRDMVKSRASPQLQKILSGLARADIHLDVRCEVEQEAAV